MAEGARETTDVHYQGFGQELDILSI